TAAEAPTSTATETATPVSVAAEVAADYVAAPLTGISGWPQTATWQDGVLDGVYSAGGGVVLLVRGGDFVTLTFAADGTPSATGPEPLRQSAAFAPLPADWLASGFDAGFHVAGGPVANSDYVFMTHRSSLAWSTAGRPRPSCSSTAATPSGASTSTHPAP